MTNKRESPTSAGTTAQPRFHQRAAEIQAYQTVNHLLPIELEEPVRLEITAQLNQLLAGTMTLRDLYKKIALAGCRAAELGDNGTNDLAVSEVLRPNELQAWFVSIWCTHRWFTQSKTGVRR